MALSKNQHHSLIFDRDTAWICKCSSECMFNGDVFEAKSSSPK
jgi:hypothetical protein